MERTEPTALRRAIFESGLSQRWIAKQADIEESLFSKYVNGWREPDADQKKRIARVMKRRVADVFPKSPDQTAVA